MIKMISFNNFDNFDGKPNAFNEAEKDAAAQNFTAILSGFTPPRSSPENNPESGQIFVKKNVSGAPESEIEAMKNFMFPPQNFKSEKATSGSQAEAGTLIETGLPQAETSVLENKMMPEQLALLDQNEDLPVKQNGEIINGKIQVNYLNQTNTNKEVVADAPVRMPIVQTVNVKNVPFEGRILTQFDSPDSKATSPWSRDQSVPRETPDVRIPNFANEERRKGNVRLVMNQENILEIPANDFPPMNASVKENPILTIETGKVETVEIVSAEFNKDFSGEKFISDFNPLDVAGFENNQVKPSAGQADILEFPEIQTSASEEIVEIKTDNFELFDLTPGKNSELDQIPINQNLPGTKFEIKTPTELDQIPINQNLPGTKFEVKTPAENAQIPLDQQIKAESKINDDSVQFKNLKYFFNYETNQVDEVKNADLINDSSPQLQATSNLTKLYDKVSEIVRQDAVSEKVRAEIDSAEISLENQVEDLWAGYSNDNQVFAANSIRGNSKPREVFDNLAVQATNSIRENTKRTKSDGEIFNELGLSAEPGRVDFTSRPAISQNPQAAAQINLNGVEKPIPKPDKALKTEGEISGLNFEKFLNPAGSEAELIHVTPNSLIEDSAVFRQLEPKVFEMAKYVDKTGETDLLKMRLNPAELGEIEIRLEKDASGKINAHIETKTEAAQQILSESLGQLRESLQNAGWQVEKLEVTHNPNQSNGNEHRENGSREYENRETGSKNAFGFDGNLEKEGEKAENPSDRLVNLRA